MKRYQFFPILFVAASISLAICFIASAQPLLSVARQGTDLLVSWSNTNSTNVVLQQNNELTSTNWVSTPEPPLSGTGTFYVVFTPTNSASFFRLFLDPTNIVDDPDDDFIDSNGDGIDGSISQAIFVSPSGIDSDPGTMTQPVQSIATAISKAVIQGKKQVYVGSGVYSFTNLTLANGVSVYGGYNSMGWSRGNENTAQLTASTTTAISAHNLSDSTTLDHLTIFSANATGPAASSYGIFASNSPALIVRQCSVKAGIGASGLNGNNGSPGANGGNGSVGNSGCENGGAFCGACTVPVGGAGGSSLCSKAGGKGGDAGLGSNSGTTGGGTLGGNGGSSGGNGAAGAPGSNGPAGTDGTAAVAGDFSGSGYVAALAGNGTAGGSGNGGGGGGGGGGGTAGCDSFGSSGGGGGGGACGGTEATGGQSGGGSFAVYLYASNARIESCSLQTGHGGRGGNAGIGGTNGTGGLGQSGGTYAPDQDDAGLGGSGGKGGNGGRGGHGGGGRGGPSIGIVRAGGSVPQISSLVYTLGSGGIGGTSSGNPGASGTVANLHP